MRLPPDAYVDKHNRCAIVVPRGWRIVDPKKVAVDAGARRGEWKLVATLISDAGGSAPTVAVNAAERPWSLSADARGIAEIERWIEATWGKQAALQMRTELTEVDNLEAFHASVLATMPDGRQLSLDEYIIPVVNYSYAIVASLEGDRRKETAKAAQAVAEGFRALKWSEYPL